MKNSRPYWTTIRDFVLKRKSGSVKVGEEGKSEREDERRRGVWRRS